MNAQEENEKIADKTINSLKLNIHDKCPRCHGEECSYCEGYGYIYNPLGLETRHKIIDALDAKDAQLEASRKEVEGLKLELEVEAKAAKYESKRADDLALLLSGARKLIQEIDYVISEIGHFEKNDYEKIEKVDKMVSAFLSTPPLAGQKDKITDFDDSKEILVDPKDAEREALERVAEAARAVLNKSWGEKPFIGIMDWNELSKSMAALDRLRGEK